MERIIATRYLAVDGMEATTTMTTLVVLTVIRHEGRYLLVEERDGTFYLPAGRVEPGENLMAAAVRETAEEAGVAIGLTGILGFDHAWRDGPPARMVLRFVFVGYLALATSPKTRPDRHSRGARWVARDEIARLPLRHPEVTSWVDRFERGPALLPCAAYGWDGPARSDTWSARLG
ncbi:MAG TPA: NUDIX domain-containing protein [Kofleriaceae bacterium]|nr:NUDIX domain-containing protein [Kofleriaceae bacterium]